MHQAGGGSAVAPQPMPDPAAVRTRPVHHGADEYVLRPTAQDAQVLLTLLAQSERAFFDLDRKVLLFGHRALA